MCVEIDKNIDRTCQQRPYSIKLHVHFENRAYMCRLVKVCGINHPLYWLILWNLPLISMKCLVYLPLSIFLLQTHKPRNCISEDDCSLFCCWFPCPWKSARWRHCSMLYHVFSTTWPQWRQDGLAHQGHFQNPIGLKITWQSALNP